MRHRLLRLYPLLLLPLSILLSPLNSACDEPAIKVAILEGDTLNKICERHLVYPEKWGEVARFNRLKDPNLIHPGEIVLIPVRLMKANSSDGKVIFLSGVAEQLVKESREWRALRLHDQIAEGSTIKTGKDSAIEIAFEDEGHLFLRPDTMLMLSVNRKSGDVYVHNLFLEIGKAITRIRQATGRESRLEIRTPSATCAPRGTEFRTSVDENHLTRCEVLEGVVSVEAMKKSVELREGEGTLVRKGEPPSKPRKLLLPPAPKDLQPIYTRMPFDIWFDKVEGAVSHRIALARDPDCKDVQLERTIKPEDPLEVSDLTDGTYFLQSRSLDPFDLEGLHSEAWPIEVRVNPVAPLIESPAEGAEYRGWSIKCRWSKVEGAVAYHLRIAEDKEFQEIIEDRADIKDLEFDTGTLDDKTYYFTIRSIAQDGFAGEWSDPVSFVAVPPPPAPLIGKPEVGEKKEIRVRWQDLGEGVTYHCQIALDREFSEILIDQRLQKPEITLQRREEGGRYYMRVSGIDSQGYEGGFSSRELFLLSRHLTED